MVNSLIVTTWQGLTPACGRSSKSGTYSLRCSGRRWRQSASNLRRVTFCQTTTALFPDFHDVKQTIAERMIVESA